jgi:hypothetical protein
MVRGLGGNRSGIVKSNPNPLGLARRRKFESITAQLARKNFT